MSPNMLWRRDLLKRTLAGAAAYAGYESLAGTTLDAAQRGGPPADLLLINGRFVDGRGIVGSALTIKNGRIAGVGTDSTNVSALDPWISLFYMTTGRNVAGVLTNAGQQVSRVEALRLYTEGAAWFSFDDHHVGSFVTGKYADLAVLSHDYLTVPEATIRRIESVLTLVGGNVVHAAPPFADLYARTPRDRA